MTNTRFRQVKEKHTRGGIFFGASLRLRLLLRHRFAAITVPFVLDAAVLVPLGVLLLDVVVDRRRRVTH